MEGSTILGWIGLGSAVLAAGSLVRSRVQPTRDPQSHALPEILTAIWLSISLGAVQKAFSIERDAIHWSLDALQIALLVFIIMQLRREWRVQSSDSKTPL